MGVFLLRYAAVVVVCLLGVALGEPAAPPAAAAARRARPVRIKVPDEEAVDGENVTISDVALEALKYTGPNDDEEKKPRSDSKRPSRDRKQPRKPRAKPLPPLPVEVVPVEKALKELEDQVRLLESKTLQFEFGLVPEAEIESAQDSVRSGHEGLKRIQTATKEGATADRETWAELVERQGKIPGSIRKSHLRVTAQLAMHKSLLTTTKDVFAKLKNMTPPERALRGYASKRLKANQPSDSSHIRDMIELNNNVRSGKRPGCIVGLFKEEWMDILILIACFSGTFFIAYAFAWMKRLIDPKHSYTKIFTLVPFSIPLGCTFFDVWMRDPYHPISFFTPPPIAGAQVLIALMLGLGLVELKRKLDTFFLYKILKARRLGGRKLRKDQ